MSEPQRLYKILSRRPSMLLDNAGRPRSGYKIVFLVPSFDETHEIAVDKLIPEVIDEKIRDFILLLEETDKLGG